jgi:hypothetical protein
MLSTIRCTILIGVGIQFIKSIGTKTTLNRYINMKVKFTIPESLADISLMQYQRYMDIVDKEDDTNFLNLKSVEIFCNLKINNLRAIKAKDYEDILYDLGESFKSKTPFKRTFKYNDTTFGFIPDLENISMGEYIDLETYLGTTKDWHKAMAVLYRPVTLERDDMYLIEDYETADKYSDIMAASPLDIYLGTQVFFYNLGRELSKHILVSSDSLMLMDSQLMRILDGSGDGTAPYMHLLQERFGDSMTSLN